MRGGGELQYERLGSYYDDDDDDDDDDDIVSWPV